MHPPQVVGIIEVVVELRFSSAAVALRGPFAISRGVRTATHVVHIEVHHEGFCGQPAKPPASDLR
jgi:hypothetical protein